MNEWWVTSSLFTCNQAESSIAKLRKKEGELEVAAQKGDGAKAEEEEVKEPRHHSIAQIIYAENRVRERERESYFVITQLHLVLYHNRKRFPSFYSTCLRLAGNSTFSISSL